MGTIDNPFIDPQKIADARRELPDDIFKQEYEGIPADDGGNPFGLNAIAACFQPGLRSDTSQPAFYGIDLASLNDFTWIIGLNVDGEVVVSERFQDDWPATKRRIAQIVTRTPCLVDETGVGDPVVRDLQETCGQTVEGFRFTSSSKQMLMVGLRNDLQDQSVRFSDERQNPSRHDALLSMLGRWYSLFFLHFRGYWEPCSEKGSYQSKRRVPNAHRRCSENPTPRECPSRVLDALEVRFLASISGTTRVQLSNIGVAQGWTSPDIVFTRCRELH